MINFEVESVSIIKELKQAHDYLGCEIIFIRHLRKYHSDGISIPEIESFLKKILIYLGALYKKAINEAEAINYKYAAAYINTLLTTSYWHSWITSVK